MEMRVRLGHVMGSSQGACQPPCSAWSPNALRAPVLVVKCCGADWEVWLAAVLSRPALKPASDPASWVGRSSVAGALVLAQEWIAAVAGVCAVTAAGMHAVEQYAALSAGAHTAEQKAAGVAGAPGAVAAVVSAATVLAAAVTHYAARGLDPADHAEDDGGVGRRAAAVVAADP
eukprot:516280-Pelagomonas_calceolata.AAC.3